MKKFFLSLAVVSALFVSCGDDDAPIVVSGGDDDGMTTDDDGGMIVDTILSGQITEDTTLTSDEIWTLDGRVTVTNGATLTIEPGTIIKALGGQEANASVLIIARDAQIQANGTASQPIIMTSSADGIEPGETVGTLSENDRGFWGGLIVLGNAPSSLDGDVTEEQIEGIPANDPNGLYGGNDSADSSGSITYLSVRHGGTDIGEGNEINGITFGGVGSGTVVDHIEVVANVDDGVEFFGGTVNATNIVVWGQGDDAIDIDQAYSGTIDNAVVILTNASDHALEIDGPEGSADGAFTLNNLSLFGNLDTEDGEYADYRDGAQGATNNVFATGFKDSSDVELSGDASAQNWLDGELTFMNWVIELPAGIPNVMDILNDDSDNGIAPEFESASFVSEGTSGGADTSVFGWTFAVASGAF